MNKHGTILLAIIMIIVEPAMNSWQQPQATAGQQRRNRCSLAPLCPPLPGGHSSCVRGSPTTRQAHGRARRFLRDGWFAMQVQVFVFLGAGSGDLRCDQASEVMAFRYAYLFMP